MQLGLGLRLQLVQHVELGLHLQLWLGLRLQVG